MRCNFILAGLLVTCWSGVALAEDPNLFGLPRCYLPVYGTPPDPSAEPDEDQAGRLLPGGTCLQLTGYAQVGTQRQRATASADPLLARLAFGTTSASARPSTLTAGFTATTARTVNGLFVGTTVTGAISDGSGAVYDDGQFLFSEASLRIERFLFGYASSRFNFWDSGDFWTGTTVPSRAAGLVAMDIWKADGLTVTISLERPELPTPAAPQNQFLAGVLNATSSRAQTPDFVAAVTHEGDEWTFFAAGAARQLHESLTNRTVAGLAGTVGASYEGEIFGATHRFSTQASITRDLPGYLGTSFDVQTVRTLVGDGESVRGWSVVASVGRDLTDAISINAYASRLDIVFPALLQTGTGRLVSSRAAANIIWNPLDNLRIGLEYGVGRVDLHLPVGARLANLAANVQLSPTGFTRVDASSATLWLEVSF